MHVIRYWNKKHKCAFVHIATLVFLVLTNKQENVRLADSSHTHTDTHTYTQYLNDYHSLSPPSHDEMQISLDLSNRERRWRRKGRREEGGGREKEE